MQTLRSSVMVLPLALIAAAVARPASAQRCPRSHSAANARLIEAFVDAASHDYALGSRAPAALRERADRYMTERYLQHHPGVESGREAFVQYHIKWYRDHPPRKTESLPPLAVVADCDLVLYVHRVPRPDPQRPAGTYESVLFDLWRIRGGKADEHWDSFLEPWRQAASTSSDPEATSDSKRDTTRAQATFSSPPPPTESIPHECAAGRIAANAELIRELASARGDLSRMRAVADRVVARGYIESNPLLSDSQYQGRDGFVRAVESRPRAIPGADFRYGSPEIILADCDYVATVKTLVRADDTGRGPNYEFYWFDLWRVENGKLARHWDQTLKGVDYRWDRVDSLNLASASATGDLRETYVFPPTGTTLSYRLYVPTTYDGSAALPLVVVLHGYGGNENSPFDEAPPALRGILQREAQRHGFIVLAPAGFDGKGDYGAHLALPALKTLHIAHSRREDDLAAADVLDTIRHVEESYRVDRNRVFLMGNSMGMTGTLELAARHPHMWCAIGPSDGPPWLDYPVERLRSLSGAFFVNGERDSIALAAVNRRLAYRVRDAGIDTRFVVVPNGDHGTSWYHALAQMFDFFAARQCTRR